MCAIIDINAAAQALGGTPSDAARKFLDSIESKKMKLVIGGAKYNEEIKKNYRIISYFRMGRLRGYVRLVNDEKVDLAAATMIRNNCCVSNDEHIIALAQVSGARLLYSNDTSLGKDFKNPTLVGGTRGRIYTTRRGPKFTQAHKRLLRRNDLCPEDALD